MRYHSINIKTLILSLLVILAVTQTTVAQNTTQLLDGYFKEVRLGKYPAIPKAVTLNENATSTLKAITTYYKDTLAIVRSKAYTITQLAGTNARSEVPRSAAVLQLISACRDKDGGNVGQVLDYLSTFHKGDFSTTAQDSLRKMFTVKPPHFEKLIRIIGFVELVDLKEQIRAYTLPGTPRAVRWSAIIALARMGDETALSNMMTRVQKLPVNDDIVYEIFPDMVYTRNKVAIDYLVKVMSSDEKNCMSADAEREVEIPCGYRIMEQLAHAIEKYPFQLDESGDLITKDYVKALQTVREWFDKNPSYTIRKDTY